MFKEFQAKSNTALTHWPIGRVISDIHPSQNNMFCCSQFVWQCQQQNWSIRFTLDINVQTADNVRTLFLPMSKADSSETRRAGGGGGWGWLLGWTVSDRFGQMLLLSFQPVMIFACPLQMSASKTGTVQRQLSSLRHVGLHCKYSESTQWWRRLGSLHLAWSWFTSFCCLPIIS